MDIRLLAVPVTIAGGAGSAYLGYRYWYQGEQKTSIKSKLGDLLLGFDDSFKEKGQYRADLVSSKSNLPESLNKLRDSSNSNKISEANIKQGCQERIEEAFSFETDSLFVSVRDYCTFNNKDKLGEKVIVETLESENLKSEGKGVKANKKLTDTSETGMSETMKEIRAKLSASGSGVTADTKALRTGCEGFYPSYFKGEKDADFKDAKLYCVETTE